MQSECLPVDRAHVAEEVREHPTVSAEHLGHHDCQDSGRAERRHRARSERQVSVYAGEQRRGGCAADRDDDGEREQRRRAHGSAA